jgi:hypothetical protein
MTAATPFDAGLQLERTALAWQRTLLALSVGFLGAGRVLLPTFGILALVVASAGLIIAITMIVIIERRYRRRHLHLTTVDGASLPSGGRLILACASLCLAAGGLALGFVLVR